MSKLDIYLNLIKNGTWHSLTKLSKNLSLPTDQLAKIAEILAKRGLIQYREESRWVKINPEWSPILFEDEEEAEHKPTAGTIILPPEESVTIQNVQITNVTQKEVELWIKVCRKSIEIAISKVT